MNIWSGLVVSAVLGWLTNLAIIFYVCRLEIRDVDGAPRLVSREKRGPADSEGGAAVSSGPRAEALQSSQCDPTAAIAEAFGDGDSSYNGYPLAEARVRSDRPGGSLFWR